MAVRIVTNAKIASAEMFRPLKPGTILKLVSIIHILLIAMFCRAPLSQSSDHELSMRLENRSLQIAVENVDLKHVLEKLADTS